MNGWRVVGPETGDAATLLAQGADLLDALAEDPVPTLRWYRAQRPTLVLGRGQATLDVSATELPVVTRATGGGAVLMDDGLLSCDVLVPAGHPLLAGDLAAVFPRVGRAWLRVLGELGLSDATIHLGATTARRRGSARERLLAAICYATLGHGEVIVGDRKLVGLAQRRRRPGALVQCGLLRRWQPDRLLAALGADPADADVAARAVGLDDLLRPAPDDATIVAAVSDELTAAG